jgi:DNA-binding response OmpR family regulator
VRDDLPEVLEHGPVRLDRRSLRVWRNHDEVTLTLRQFEILLALLANRGRVLSRAELARWRPYTGLRGLAEPKDGPVAHRAVDVAVSHLRRELGPDLIETVRGVGYRLGRPSPVRDPRKDSSRIPPKAARSPTR